ncbi:hypothetical protein CJ030_MR0G019220 [Morella rubra]|uniref:Uncharacterized protein n=1 Tax=Morella rubra TaxID=262757 RepID=A0A6A1UHH0_9ROSI|nr:hypothetical protein CJ030_MR0G019220 [Morella rubra]
MTKGLEVASCRPSHTGFRFDVTPRYELESRTMRGKQVEPMISEHLGLSGISLEKVVALSPDSIYGAILHAALFELAEHSPSKIRFKIVIDPCEGALTITNPSDPLEVGFGENWAEEYTPFLRILSWEKRAVAIKERCKNWINSLGDGNGNIILKLALLNYSTLDSGSSSSRSASAPALLSQVSNDSPAPPAAHSSSQPTPLHSTALEPCLLQQTDVG